MARGAVGGCPEGNERRARGGRGAYVRGKFGGAANADA
jgi:hypothetical protein